MMKKLALALSGALLIGATPVYALAPTDLLKAIQSGDYNLLSPEIQAAVRSGTTAAEAAQALGGDAEVLGESALDIMAQMRQQAREAYVAALPPRDRELGRQVLLGDYNSPDSPGKLYYFVSRTMSESLLRAYALEAMSTGGTLIVKGPRRGNTIKEFVQDAMADFNTVEGLTLASIEMNPNLFDMFKVEVVPTIVWTTRMGLEDIGSGCEALDEEASPKIALEDHNSNTFMMAKPTCAPVAENSYYKIAGTVTTWYALEAFENAGAPKLAMEGLRENLRDRLSNVNVANTGAGQEIQAIPDDIRIENLPRHILAYWQEELSTQRVQRTPLGPVFSDDGEDDPEYRAELLNQIERGLSSRSREE